MSGGGWPTSLAAEVSLVVVECVGHHNGGLEARTLGGGSHQVLKFLAPRNETPSQSTAQSSAATGPRDATSTRSMEDVVV